MGFYEESLKSLEQSRILAESELIYSKSLVSIMKTIQDDLGTDHNGDSIYSKFDHVAIDNIIAFNQAKIEGYQRTLDKVNNKIEKVKNKLESNDSVSELVDSLFAPMMEEYKEFEGKDIFDLLDDLED